MEQLALRKLEPKSQMAAPEDPDVPWDGYDEDDDSDEEDGRVEEGRRMFQIFAAKMFEQRVLSAYKEKVCPLYYCF